MDQSSLSTISASITNEAASSGMASKLNKLSTGYTETFEWGCDSESQMGLGEGKSGKKHSVPRFCSFGVVINAISCGKNHSAFIAQNGFVYSMGSNEFGKLGLSTSIRKMVQPQLIESLSKVKACQISCGYDHTVTLTSQGEVFTFGRNTEGQLGIGIFNNQSSPRAINLAHLNSSNVPIVTSISCGAYHTLLLLKSGKSCGFGSNRFGQLGIANWKNASQAEIQNISERVEKISAGLFHSIVLTDSGKVYSCGQNSEGQLGHNHKLDLNALLKIDRLSNAKLIAARQHSAAITNQGELYLFGSGAFGEYIYPQKINLFNDIVMEDVSIGDKFGCALDTFGNIYSWGINDKGQLGLGDFETRNQPNKMVCLEGKRVTRICCGDSYCIALGKTVIPLNDKQKRSSSGTQNRNTNIKRNESGEQRITEERNSMKQRTHNNSNNNGGEQKLIQDQMKEQLLRQKEKGQIDSSIPLRSQQIGYSRRSVSDLYQKVENNLIQKQRSSLSKSNSKCNSLNKYEPKNDEKSRESSKQKRNQPALSEQISVQEEEEEEKEQISHSNQKFNQLKFNSRSGIKLNQQGIGERLLNNSQHENHMTSQGFNDEDRDIQFHTCQQKKEQNSSFLHQKQQLKQEISNEMQRQYTSEIYSKDSSNRVRLSPEQQFSSFINSKSIKQKQLEFINSTSYQGSPQKNSSSFSLKKKAFQSFQEYSPLQQEHEAYPQDNKDFSEYRRQLNLIKDKVNNKIQETVKQISSPSKIQTIKSNSSYKQYDTCREQQLRQDNLDLNIEIKDLKQEIQRMKSLNSKEIEHLKLYHDEEINKQFQVNYSLQEELAQIKSQHFEEIEQQNEVIHNLEDEIAKQKKEQIAFQKQNEIFDQEHEKVISQFNEKMILKDEQIQQMQQKLNAVQDINSKQSQQLEQFTQINSEQIKTNYQLQSEIQLNITKMESFAELKQDLSAQNKLFQQEIDYLNMQLKSQQNNFLEQNQVSSQQLQQQTIIYEQLRQQLNSTMQLYEELKVQSQQYYQQYEQHKQLNNKLMQESSNNSSLCSNYQKLYEDSQIYCQQLTQSLEKQNQLAEQYKKESEEYQSIIQDQQSQLTSLRIQIEQQQKENEIIDQSCKKYEKINEQQKQKCQDSYSLCEQYKSDIQNYNQSIIELKLLNESYKKQIEENKKSQEYSKQEYEQAKQQQLSEHNQQCEIINAQLDKSKMLLEKESQQLSEQQQNYHSMQLKFTQELHQVKQELQTSRLECHSLQSKIDQQQLSLSKSQQDLEEYQNIYHSSKSTISELHLSLKAQYDATVTQFNSKIEEFKRRELSFKNEQSIANDQLQEKEEEIITLQGIVESLEIKLEDQTKKFALQEKRMKEFELRLLDEEHFDYKSHVKQMQDKIIEQEQMREIISQLERRNRELETSLIENNQQFNASASYIFQKSLATQNFEDPQNSSYQTRSHSKSIQSFSNQNLRRLSGDSQNQSSNFNSQMSNQTHTVNTSPSQTIRSGSASKRFLQALSANKQCFTNSEINSTQNENQNTKSSRTFFPRNSNNSNSNSKNTRCWTEIDRYQNTNLQTFSKFDKTSNRVLTLITQESPQKKTIDEDKSPQYSEMRRVPLGESKVEQKENRNQSLEKRMFEFEKKLKDSHSKSATKKQ